MGRGGVPEEERLSSNTGNEQVERGGEAVRAGETHSKAPILILGDLPYI